MFYIRTAKGIGSSCKPDNDSPSSYGAYVRHPHTTVPMKFFIDIIYQ